MNDLTSSDPPDAQTIKAKLEAEGHATSDVVAVKSNADGSVIVYVDDRA